MNYNQRDYLYYMQPMQPMQPLQQMPFPMMYPYPDLYMNEIEAERDLENLRQMYPAEAKEVQKKVEEACDKLEYEGSMMYDEYPDRVTLMLICDRIMDELSDKSEPEDKEYRTETEAEPILAMERRPGERPMGRSRRRRDLPRSLVEVLLYNEMHKRRCRQRNCRRFW